MRDIEAANELPGLNFVATMSHELREPLSGVLGMARLLRDTPLDSEQGEYVRSLLGAGEALLTLVNDLLDLSKIQAGEVELDEINFRLVPFVERLHALLEPRARQKGIEFGITMSAQCPEELRGDPARFRRVLLNLLSNAIKFTDEGSVTLVLDAEEKPDGSHELQCVIEDTGIGMPAEARGRIFDAFVQANHSVERLYGGSGLGLAISQQLLDLMGGSLDLDAEREVGTKWAVRVPMAKSLSPESEGDGVGSLQGQSLLVIDPQERSRSMICDLATLWRMSARAAKSIPEATTILEDAADRGQAFDVVIMDREIEGGSAFELGRVIGSEPRFANPALVMLTNSGFRGDAQMAKEAGFSAYLPKPLSADNLLETLQKLAGRSGDTSGLITVYSLEEQRPAPKKVLVADDNEMNRRIAQIMLEKGGHHVVSAPNGEEALNAVSAGDFDLVLMDVQMPVLDGLEATRRIRALENSARAKTPILAVTANALEGDETSCLEAGMQGYLTKPIDTAGLLAAVDNYGRSI